MNYIIVPSKYLRNVNFEAVEQTGPHTLRYSLDGEYFLLKYEGEQPRFVFAITNDAIGLPEYTHLEILKILDRPEWKR